MAEPAELTPDALFPIEELPPAGVRAPDLPARVLALGGLFLLLGAALRFAQVGWREAFGGELTTLAILGVDGLNGPTSFGDAVLSGRLPLYDWFMALYAMATGTASLTLLRLPSAIFGVLGCVAFLVLAGKYMRGTAFTVAAMLFCLNPTFIRASNDATTHGLLGFVAVLAHLLVIRALDEGEFRRWTRYGAVCVVGVLVHPAFWGLVAGHFVFALVRRRRVPPSFRRFAKVGGALLAAFSFTIGILAMQALGRGWKPSFPIDDTVANLVGLLFGDFMRYPTNIFFQALLYLLLIGGLVLAGLYHNLRKAEAELLPEEVGFIDQTQDVVGTWRRLSLETFLMLNWCAVGGVVLGVLGAGIISDRFPIQPHSLLPALAPLCLLLAVGVDMLPDPRQRLALALAYLAIGGWFTFHALNDRGFGVNQAARIIRGDLPADARTRILFVDRAPLAGAVAFHFQGLDPQGVSASSTPSGLAADSTNVPMIVGNADRVYVIYFNDRRMVNKQPRSPVREYLANPDGPFTEVKKYENLSPYEPTELRIYQRKPN